MCICPGLKQLMHLCIMAKVRITPVCTVQSKTDLEKTGRRARLPEDSVVPGQVRTCSPQPEDESVFRQCQD